MQTTLPTTAFNQVLIFWPVLALVAWTFLVLVQIPIRRFSAAFAGRVTAKDFQCGESSHVPADVALPNRAFINLTEVPMLFYTVCIILYVTKNVDLLVVAMAWVYLALRIAHSLIYMTYNHIIHRFATFALSNFVVLALTAYLAAALAK